MEKQGFSADNYNLSPEEAGQAALVNECIEALADGFQFSEDGFTAYAAGKAILEAVLKNKHSKEAVIVVLVKLAIANIFDELAENSKVIAAQAMEIASQKKEIDHLGDRMLKLKASARR